MNGSILLSDRLPVTCGANPRTKSNSPMRVGDRYNRGTRRWSFFDSKRKPKTPQTNLTYWTITVTAGEYGQAAFTYSCDCPDFSKKVVGSFYGEDNPPTQALFTPRIFDARALKNYGSSYKRYMKGQALISRVDFAGIQSGPRYIYKIWSDRNAKLSRDWSATEAGTQPGQYCKHIWAVIVRRGDDHLVPTDVPDYEGF